MSQVSHPYGFRLVTLRGWLSKWVAPGKIEYRGQLQADVLIREFLERKLRSQSVSQVIIERDRNTMKILIHTSRPGLVIGRSGEGISNVRKIITVFAAKRKLMVPKEIKIDIVEILNPDADAKIIALQIAADLERRQTFKRVMRMYSEKVMQARGVKGVRIVLAGRLGGAEMARREEVKLGSIPLQFIRADIDYAVERAKLTYGTIGIKVWINKGDILKQEAAPLPEPRTNRR
jgi:small subunit ribosomal protein S3